MHGWRATTDREVTDEPVEFEKKAVELSARFQEK
jgi:hypothetical protein